MAAPLRLEFDPAGRLLAAARECEAQVFLQAYGNTREQLEAEYAAYEPNSVFVALADEDDDVLGIVRLLAPGGRLKTLDDLAGPPWSTDAERAVAAARIDLSSTWDVATIGVRPVQRRHRTRLAFALYHSLIVAARANDASSFMAILDERVRRLLDSVGIVMHALPGAEPQPYLGSAASTPVYAHLAPMLERQRRELPDAYRLVTLGAGLDGVRVPSMEHFRHVRHVPAAWQQPVRTAVPAGG
jgi:hypothetical protein